VGRAVHLDGEPGCGAVEVEHEPAERDLAAEADARAEAFSS
jgi:hypothetical protein